MESSLTDEALWQAFSTSTLPAEAWTHRAHLRMAWLFLKRHPLDEAHLLLRVGIIRLNAFHGLVETPVRGYHETLTRLWLALIVGTIVATYISMRLTSRLEEYMEKEMAKEKQDKKPAK